MAVAIATLPHSAQMPAVYAQEAQDALLDALLSSCEKPRNAPLKSFGRDLKPYFPAADVVPSSAAKSYPMQKSVRRKASPQPVASAAAAAAASTKQAPKDAPKLASAHKKGAIMRSKNSPPRKRSSPDANANGVSSPTAPLVAFNSGEMAAFLSWAGPGFYVAPTPDKLPLPSTTLLE